MILEIEHRRHLLAAAVICASAVWAAAGGPFADLASAAAVQEKRPDGAVPVQYENNPQLPAAITEAYLQAGEPSEPEISFLQVLPVDGTDPVRAGLPNKLPARRDLTFTAKIANRSAYPITQLRLAIENPSFLPNHLITIVCRLSGAAEKTANHNQPLKPNDLFTFSRKLPVEDKRDDQELLKHLSGFRLRVIGVSYSSEDDQLWLNSFLRDYDQDGMMVLRTRKDLRGISRDELLQIWRTQTPNGQPGRAALAVGRIIAENPKVSPQAQGPIGDPTGVPTPPQGGVPPVDPDPQASPQTVPYMRPDLKPTILYKEKAKYTPEARANGIQGTVVLSVIFGTDGTISGIRVVRGLPDGLTEKAIEAARKIRFHPAVKNGEAVSVRGNIEFTFEL